MYPLGLYEPPTDPEHRKIILRWIGGVTGLAVAAIPCVVAWEHLAKPEFKVVNQQKSLTEVNYKTSRWPTPLPLEVSALREFSKSIIGEEIILHGNRGKISLKRTSETWLPAECGEFTVRYGVQPPVQKSFCSGRYPSGPRAPI